MPKSADSLGQAAATRDLARRARRLAQGLPTGADKTRLLSYADELDEQAAQLEKEAGGPHDQVQQQQQQQQQEPSDPPTKPRRR
jgi:hypothetical protein